MESISPDEQQQLIQAAQGLKVTLSRMKKLGILPIPENYTVWYEYAMGTVLELNKAIDDLLNSGTPFTNKINHELYTKYVADRPIKMIDEIQQQTELIVNNLLDNIRQLGEGTGQFSAALERCDQQLKDNPGIESLSQLVECLLDESNKVKKANRSMEDSLASMNAEVKALRGDMEKLNNAVMMDPLTKIANRRAFDEQFELLFNNFKDHGEIFSVLMMDIDFFKKFNDTYGHMIGDKVLTFVATIMKNVLNEHGFLARYGGEEFICLLPDTHYPEARLIAENVRAKVAEKPLTSGADKKKLGIISISVGVATINSNDDEISPLQRADQMLYQAKRNGRNCVVGENDKLASV